MTVDCMREQLLEGKKIRLGDLGDFSIVLSSKGAEDADKFTAQMAALPQAAAIRATLDRTAMETTNWSRKNLMWNTQKYKFNL